MAEKIEAPEGYVFAIRYTVKLDRKLFYPFYATSYFEKDGTVEFENARVPGTIIAGSIIERYGQNIRKPILDKKLATIFVFKTEKPDWFEKTEDDMLKYIESQGIDEENIEYTNMDSFLEPILNKIIKTI